MVVINFPERNTQKATQGQTVAKLGGVEPKPNLEDPHSSDFPDEPRYDKTEGLDFLSIDDILSLRRLMAKYGLAMTREGSVLSLHKPVRFNSSQGGIKSLFGHKPTQLPIAEITCKSGHVHNLSASYKIAAEDKIIEAACFRALLGILDRHIETGSPDLPEPDFWR